MKRPLTKKEKEFIENSYKTMSVKGICSKLNRSNYAVYSYIRNNNLRAPHFSNLYELTPREEEVIKLMSQGFTNNQIAEKLFISLTTVKTHIVNISQKYQLDLSKNERHVFRVRLILIWLNKNNLIKEKKNDKIYC